MTCRTLSRTQPSHIVPNISTASEYGIEFSPDWSTSAALQRDCCVGIRDAHPRLVPIGASNQSITNTDSSGNRAFPVIVREQEFTFDFYWHELFRFSYNQHRNGIGAGDSRLGVDLLGQGKLPRLS